MPLELPNGQTISAEIDTGSQSLILHEKFMQLLGISPSSPAILRRDGEDETGHRYTRYFASLAAGVRLPNAPETKIAPMDVMFQKIIYDGLVGHHFLRNFVVTYNLPEAQMIFRNSNLE